jgi:hypothetical protein
LIQRRDFLRNNKINEYKKLVMKMDTKEDKAVTNFLEETFKHIGLKNEFMQTHQFYMMNPQTQQILMEARMGIDTKTPPSITCQKTKEIFLDSEEKVFESMKKMM